jgi:hypothetical protein
MWWLVRNRRISLQPLSQRCPTMSTRAFGASAAMPCNPPMRSRASAPIVSETFGETAATS